MSKAFFKPGVPPKLLHKFKSSEHSKRAVEVWLTPCIVTKLGKTSDASCKVLINPANPQLSGIEKFAYFPKGGPVPKDPPKGMFAGWQPLGYVTSWGGMEVGGGMLYASSVVDGIVHQLGGWRFKIECSMVNVVKKDERVPVGSSATTGPGLGSDLSKEYDAIVHTTPPFYNYFNEGDPSSYLRQCYQNSLKMAFEEISSSSDENSNDSRVAIPLLGAGGRGFPIDVAIGIAASEAISWSQKHDKMNGQSEVLAFGLPEISNANMLINELKRMELQ